VLLGSYENFAKMDIFLFAFKIKTQIILIVLFMIFLELLAIYYFFGNVNFWGFSEN